MPKHIFLAGNCIEVVRKQYIEVREDRCDGAAIHSNMTIEIDANVEQEYARMVFLHEILHFAADAIGFEADEPFIERVSHALMEFFMANPAMIRFIAGDRDLPKMIFLGGIRYSFAPHHSPRAIEMSESKAEITIGCDLAYPVIMYSLSRILMNALVDSVGETVGEGNILQWAFGSMIRDLIVNNPDFVDYILEG